MVTLSHAFLQENPILLEEGVLRVNWNQIPSLYTQVNQMLTVGEVGSPWQLDNLGTGLSGNQLCTQHGSSDV